MAIQQFDYDNQNNTPVEDAPTSRIVPFNYEEIVSEQPVAQVPITPPLAQVKPQFKKFSELSTKDKIDLGFNRLGLKVGSGVGAMTASTIKSLSYGKDLIKGTFSGSTISEELANDTTFDKKVKGFADEYQRLTSQGMSEQLSQKKAELGLDPEDQFTDKVFEGLGSLFGFVGTGFASKIGSVAVGFGKYAPVVASGVNTAGESLMEAQDVYETVKAEGGDDKKAFEAFRSTLAGNALLIGLTNKLGGMFDDTLYQGIKRAVKVGFSGTMEGIQEGYQTLLSNANTGKPLFEGVKESFLIGTILGAPASAALDFGDRSKAKEQIDAMDVPQEQKDVAKAIVDKTATEEEISQAFTQAITDPESGITADENVTTALKEDVQTLLDQGQNIGEVVIALQEEGIKKSDAENIVAEILANQQQQAETSTIEVPEEGGIASPDVKTVAEEDKIKTVTVPKGEKVESSFEDKFGGQFNSTIAGDKANVYDVFAKERGHGLYEAGITDLSNKGVKEITVTLQTKDSSEVLKRLVEKGILENPRNPDPRVKDGVPRTFDIVQKETAPKEDKKPVENKEESGKKPAPVEKKEDKTKESVTKPEEEVKDNTYELYIDKEIQESDILDSAKTKETLDGLYAQKEAIENTGFLSLQKFESKRGEFKGQLNINNGTGKFFKEYDTRLREVFNDINNKLSSEELIEKYDSLKSQYQEVNTNIAELEKILKSQLALEKFLEKGSDYTNSLVAKEEKARLIQEEKSFKEAVKKSKKLREAKKGIRSVAKNLEDKAKELGISIEDSYEMKRFVEEVAISEQYLENNKDKIDDILDGSFPYPKDVSKTAFIHTIIENAKANNDTKMLTKAYNALAEEGTTAGQNIAFINSIYKTYDETSPETYLNKIRAERESMAFRKDWKLKNPFAIDEKKKEFIKKRTQRQKAIKTGVKDRTTVKIKELENILESFMC